MSCPNGFRLDKSGCPGCECQKCQSLLGCKLSCSRGFKVDGFGCTTCDCIGDNEPLNSLVSSSSSSSQSRNGNNEANQQEISSTSSSPDQSVASSPTMKLDQRNLLGNPGNNKKDLIGRNGHQYHFQDGNRYHHHQHNNRPHHHHNPQDENDDNDGSEDHDDDEDLYGYGYGYGSNEPRSPSSSSSSGRAHVVFCTVDSDGVRRTEGEEWSDHCRRCLCRNGKEMCSLITCQAPPKCEHPIFYPGDCCPRCPGSYKLNPNVHTLIYV